MTQTRKAERLLEEVLGALSGSDWRAILDAIEVPTYLTDKDGNVTYWNRACAEFAGREPQLGSDRWCVTWKLYTTAGELLPHDACPMAVALKEQRVVRNAVAIAERPDGTRCAFTPYPTPLLDEAGELKGAVNLLMDVSAEHGRDLRSQADRCRRLARSVTDAKASRVLDDMAFGYEQAAASLSPG
jgi:PAS domain S-box-containing protein